MELANHIGYLLQGKHKMRNDGNWVEADQCFLVGMTTTTAEALIFCMYPNITSNETSVF